MPTVLSFSGSTLVDSKISGNFNLAYMDLPAIAASVIFSKFDGTVSELDTDEPESFGVDKIDAINVHFHKRRLTEDQDLFVRIGDFVQYDSKYWEITAISEPRYLFGQDPHKLELVAKCKRAREGLFDAN